MPTDHSQSAAPSQTGEDDGPELEFIVRMHAAAKAGKALLDAVEAGDAISGAHAALAARAAYDRLDETRQRASG